MATRANLNPATLKPTLAQRARAELARLEIIIRRLARTRERQCKAGEARPFLLAMPNTHRVPRELGAIATALPEMLKAALESWDNSSCIRHTIRPVCRASKGGSG